MGGIRARGATGGRRLIGEEWATTAKVIWTIAYATMYNCPALPSLHSLWDKANQDVFELAPPDLSPLDLSWRASTTNHIDFYLRRDLDIMKHTLILAALLAAGIVGCDSKPPAPAPKAAETTPAPAAAPAAAPAPAGDAAKAVDAAKDAAGDAAKAADAAKGAMDAAKDKMGDAKDKMDTAKDKMGDAKDKMDAAKDKMGDSKAADIAKAAAAGAAAGAKEGGVAGAAAGAKAGAMDAMKK